MKIAVLGLGFLGSTIFKWLNTEYEVIGITRDNYNDHVGEYFDIFINANGNSRKYLAEQDPLKDFELSVLSVYKSLFDFKFNKYIYISSVCIYEDSIYGKHKQLAETLIEYHTDNYLFARCCAIVGKEMKKGILYDILNHEPLRVTLDSKIQLISDNQIAKQIDEYIRKESNHKWTLLASYDSIVISDIYKMLNIKPNILPDAKHINYHNIGVGFESYCKDYIKEVI